MMRSGLKVPTPAMPIPDFAVPYAAPIAIAIYQSSSFDAMPSIHGRGVCVHPKIIAAAMPPCNVGISMRVPFPHVMDRTPTIPMKGANLGESSDSAIVMSSSPVGEDG